MSISQKEVIKKNARKALTGVARAAKRMCTMYVRFLNNRYVQESEDLRMHAPEIKEGKTPIKNACSSHAKKQGTSEVAPSSEHMLITRIFIGPRLLNTCFCAVCLLFSMDYTIQICLKEG